jgi:hypothetical protein
MLHQSTWTLCMPTQPTHLFVSVIDYYVLFSAASFDTLYQAVPCDVVAFCACVCSLHVPLFSSWCSLCGNIVDVNHKSKGVRLKLRQLIVDQSLHWAWYLKNAWALNRSPFLALTDLTVHSVTSDQISRDQKPNISLLHLEGLILPPKYGLVKFNEVLLGDLLSESVPKLPGGSNTMNLYPFLCHVRAKVMPGSIYVKRFCLLKMPPLSSNNLHLMDRVSSTA